MSKPLSKNPDRIRDMFDNVAGQYDRLNRLLSLGLDRFWRRRMIEKIEGQTLLDLACGSGDVLQQANGSVDSSFGLDFSHSMLHEANRKLNSVESHLTQGDALNLPYNSGTADVVTCAFGVRNFADRPEAFREVNRVLKTGGKFLILEFFPPENTLLNKPLRWYMSTILPAFGQLISNSKDAYEYLNDSIETFVSSDEMKDEILESGFDDCDVESIFFGLVKLITAKLQEVPHRA
jgi:demethylmenaquinone methyltransferase/2-methoxy-6-polyprenyl-1,4-benzoquinol methylase